MASTAIDRLDGLSSSAAIKGPCRVATTANIALYGLQTIDGIALADDDRVLVKDQTAGYENGIYVVDTGQWRRSKDFNKTRDVVKGTAVFVTDGTAHSETLWSVTSDNPVVVGTDDIDFSSGIIVPPDGSVGPDQLTNAPDIRNFLDTAPYVANRTALKALDTTKDTVAHLKESGRDGIYQWFAGDFSAEIAADPQEYVYVKADAIAASAGAWVFRVGGITEPTSFSIPADFSTLNDFADYIRPRRISANVSVTVAAGIISHSELVVWDHPDAKFIEIDGVSANITVASVGAATGSAFAWDVPLTLSDATGITTDHWIYIQAKITSGSSDGSNIEGTWRVISVVGNVVTIRVTSVSASFPAISDTNFAALVLQTTLRWDSNVTGGLYIRGTAAGLFRYLVLDGQYDVATGVGDDNAGNGVFIGGFSHTILGLSDVYMPGTASATMYYCAAVRWKADGFLLSGNVMLDAAFSHACANGWRGMQSGALGSGLWAKSGVASGNRKSGFECESQASAILNNSVACGNDEAGYYAAINGGITATNSRAMLNTNYGTDLRDRAVGEFSGTVFKGNSTAAISLDRASYCRGDSIVSSGHTYGVTAQNGSYFRAAAAPTITDTTPYRAFTSSPGFYEIAGINGPMGTGLFCNAVSGAQGGFVLVPVSSGQLAVQLRTTGAGSATTTYAFSGTAFQPSSDNVINLGGASNRWANGFINQLRPGSGTAIWTTGAGSPEGVLTAVVGSLYTDTTGGKLYVKATGTGNTGWVVAGTQT